MKPSTSRRAAIYSTIGASVSSSSATTDGAFQPTDNGVRCVNWSQRPRQRY
ncbi:hypothetical protein QT381_03730 [Galbitalea sp. SE-J8]|uniref:hypothetical protein n=1 Tax=Galbitalea sp. SE-J8 TaxID=3054952 RepID=UPI00259CAE4F|nr:hypothetical protein [Galbitalea sp. SE-J8]MDM4762114.1 hypothetical protein [Galbitalea sp. SE-J8]